MARRGQHGLSDSQKRDLWARWKQGQPMSEIARALEKNHGSIHYAVSLHGGIVPVERRRSRLALSLLEELGRPVPVIHSSTVTDRHPRSGSRMAAPGRACALPGAIRSE